MDKVSAGQSIAGVMQRVNAVGKKDRNEAQRFNFRGIDAVVNAIGPALREVGGCIVPTVLEKVYERGITKSGTPTVETFLTVEYAWYGTDGGEPVRGVVPGEAMDTSDKATAKAMSVALRTFLLQTLMLPTDEKDPDAEYHERAKTVKAPVPVPIDFVDRVKAAADMPALSALWQEAVDAGFENTVSKMFSQRKAEVSK